MSNTYRAAYLVPDSSLGECIFLTGPEHASMNDEELRSEALSEAQRADIIDMRETDPQKAYPRLTREQFAEALTIGGWTD